ncbi:MAG: hypothetical protein DRG39_01565 [Deltaproteobacteria bacterium]|nr:MAG: hypothetical protein DRG39_01565 [Deltaproteobacteria bacterium]
MEFKDFIESWKAFYKMGYSIGKTNLELTKLAMDSFGSMYEIYVRQFMPSEVSENIKKSMAVYMESQARVFDNFKKLVDQLEKQSDEIFDRIIEFGMKAAPSEGAKK